MNTALKNVVNCLGKARDCLWIAPYLRRVRINSDLDCWNNGVSRQSGSQLHNSYISDLPYISGFRKLMRTTAPRALAPGATVLRAATSLGDQQTHGPTYIFRQRRAGDWEDRHEIE